jgi:hypothetical protein
VTTGVGKGFAPSVAAANAALAGKTGVKVHQDAHPPGVEGTSYSLEKMGKFIRDGRLDPRIRGWAGQVIMKAGKPKTVKAQTQAILDEIRRVTFYTQDPVNCEAMVKPAISLCLDKESGLCIPAVDCDDRCIILGSAMLSLGIEIKILGQAYGTQQASHVIISVLDENGNWLKVDPSSETYPVGTSYPATKEWWMDPISGTISSSSSGGSVMSMGKEPEHGDFIGVGAVPVEGVGVFPLAHAFAIGNDSAADVPVGMERGMDCFPCGRPTEEAKEYAFQQQLIKGLGAAPVGGDANAVAVHQSHAATYEFNSTYWAFVGPSWTVDAPAGSPTTNGQWTQPLAAPLSPERLWIWYPLPGHTILVNGRQVSTSSRPGWTQTLPGYFVGPAPRTAI